MLAVREVRRADELADYRRDWQHLLVRSGADFFQSYEWITSWLQSFWRGRPIAFLFVRDAGTLVGLAPFLDDDKHETWCPKTLVLPFNPHAHRTDVLHAGDPAPILDAVLSHLRQTRRGFRLSFRQVPTSSAALGVLPDVARRHRMRAVGRAAPASPIVQFAGAWAPYLRSRSRHVRSELRRKGNRARRAGRLEWIVVDDAARVEGAMADLLRIERRSWKEDRASSISAEPGARGFYTQLARRCAEAGSLRLHLLYLDAVPVAYIFGVVHGREYYALKTSFDARHGRLSPGAVLFEHALRDAAEHGVDTFDLLGVGARWKGELATGWRAQTDVCVFPSDRLTCQICRRYTETVKPLVRTAMPTVVRFRRWVSAAFRG